MAIETYRNLFGVDSKLTMEIGDSTPDFGGTELKGYVFRTEIMRRMSVFLTLKKRACMISGHKGCGKTSLVDQLHLRTRRNLKSMNGNGKTTLEHLFGQYIPNERGSLDWVDGPVTWAAKTGGSVCINEFNAIPEDVQLSVMEIAHDGSPFAIPELGIQFMPHPEFRLFCTINPKGGKEFMYKGRNDIDAALKERFFWILMGYGSREEELQILLNVWTQTLGLGAGEAKSLSDQMLNVAEEVRTLSSGTGRNAIPEIISTRVLVNWAIYWKKFVNLEGSVHIALESALTGGCTAVVRQQIHNIVALKTSVKSPNYLATA